MKTAAIITIIVLLAAAVSFALSANRAKKKAETGIYLTGYQRELTIGSLMTTEHELMDYMKEKQEAGEELIGQAFEKTIDDIRAVELLISGGPELLEIMRKEWDDAEERNRAQEAAQEPAEAPEDGAPLVEAFAAEEIEAAVKDRRHFCRARDCASCEYKTAGCFTDFTVISKFLRVYRKRKEAGK